MLFLFEAQSHIIFIQHIQLCSKVIFIRMYVCRGGLSTVCWFFFLSWNSWKKFNTKKFVSWPDLEFIDSRARANRIELRNDRNQREYLHRFEWKCMRQKNYPPVKNCITRKISKTAKHKSPVPKKRQHERLMTLHSLFPLPLVLNLI